MSGDGAVMGKFSEPWTAMPTDDSESHSLFELEFRAVACVNALEGYDPAKVRELLDRLEESDSDNRCEAPWIWELYRAAKGGDA